jgi:hypothetical protein
MFNMKYQSVTKRFYNLKGEIFQTITTGIKGNGVFFYNLGLSLSIVPSSALGYSTIIYHTILEHTDDKSISTFERMLISGCFLILINDFVKYASDISRIEISRRRIQAIS